MLGWNAAEAGWVPSQKRISFCNLAGSFGFIASVFDTTTARFVRMDRLCLEVESQACGGVHQEAPKGGKKRVAAPVVIHEGASIAALA